MKKTVAVSAVMGEGWAVKAEIGNHRVVIDQPKDSGGTDQGPSPLSYFLFSLAGCIGTIGRIAAHQQQIDLRGMEINVEADLNPLGLMGKEIDDRVGFQQIRVTAKIDADLDEKQKLEFLDAVCERCPLHDNIKLATEVDHRLIES